ncbi:MAG: AAA family ATPase [Chloroflexaceae bacterium]
MPLVGRQEALARLQQAYADACRARGSVILISGEAGIGKSRLMQEFAASLADRALMLAGVSYPGGQAVPYQPIVQALRSLLKPGDQKTTRQGGTALSPPLPLSWSPPWLAEAARLLPELRTWYPGLPPDHE